MNKQISLMKYKIFHQTMKQEVLKQANIVETHDIFMNIINRSFKNEVQALWKSKIQVIHSFTLNKVNKNTQKTEKPSLKRSITTKVLT